MPKKLAGWTGLVALFIFLAICRADDQKQAPEEPARIDMQGFILQTVEAAEYRRSRTIRVDEFLRLAKQKDTILLDTRSKAAFDRKHLSGAVHLNFSDFTTEKLAAIIPTKETRVLIYCNNNLGGDRRNFASKSVRLALNIPTFVNLYGYGYKNIYELGSFVSVDDGRLKFEGSDVP